MSTMIATDSRTSPIYFSDEEQDGIVLVRRPTGNRSPTRGAK